ncbi:hypothetical protein D9M71_401410 [compost metagenome]
MKANHQRLDIRRQKFCGNQWRTLRLGFSIQGSRLHEPLKNQLADTQPTTDFRGSQKPKTILADLLHDIAVNRHESILAFNGNFSLDLSCGYGRTNQLRAYTDQASSFFR